MNKIILSLLLAIVGFNAYSQADVNRTNKTPLSGANANKQSVRDANLTAVLNLRIPVASSFTLNNAKDSTGYILYNTSIQKMGIYKGSGAWDTLATSSMNDLANYYTKTQADARYKAIGYTPSNGEILVALGYTPVPNTRTVNGQPLSSNVTLTKSDVGLGNADNTSDANKPVSMATQTALDGKANLGGGNTFSGNQVIPTGSGGFSGDSFILNNADVVANTFFNELRATTLTASRITTFPNASITVAGIQSGLTASTVNAPNVTTVNTALSGKVNTSDFNTLGDARWALTDFTNVASAAIPVSKLSASTLNLTTILSNTATSLDGVVQNRQLGSGGFIIDFPKASTSGSDGGLLSYADWTTFNNKQSALGFTPENVTNKATNLTSPDNTKYPTTLAVANAISGLGTGSVTSVSVTTANGVSGSVATSTTTPAITLTLGAITPTTVNGITLSGTGSVANSGTSSLTGFTGSGSSFGSNTGDQTITLTGDITGSGTGSFTTTIASGVIVNSDVNAAAGIDATKLIDGSVTNAELGYINTLTSNAQTQIDGKAPIGAKYIVQQADATLTGEQALGALGTGILKNTTTTGVLSIAVAGDFPTLNQSTTGSAATLTTGRTIGIITGDATSTGSTFNGSANNTNSLTLVTVNSNVGSFGGASSVPNFTVNAKGLITAAGATAVVAPAGTLTGTTLASGVTASSLTSVGTLTGLTLSGAVTGTLANFYGTTGNGYVRVGAANSNTGLFTLANSAGTDYWGLQQTLGASGQQGNFVIQNIGLGTTAMSIDKASNAVTITTMIAGSSASSVLPGIFVSHNSSTAPGLRVNQIGSSSIASFQQNAIERAFVGNDGSWNGTIDNQFSQVQPVTGTNSSYGRIINTGGGLIYGVETATGGYILSGSGAYSASVGSIGATALNLGTNGVSRITISGTGATTVSGALTVSNSGSSVMYMDRPSTGFSNAVVYRTGPTSNWGSGSSFTSANTDLEFYNYSLSNDWLKVSYATNATTFSGNMTGTTATFSGNVTAASYTTSDTTLKKNIVRLPRVTDIMRRIDPVSYEMKADGKPGIGFKGQQINTLWPTLTARNNGIITVNYSQMISPVLKYAQETDDRVTKLEVIVKKQDARILFLEQALLKLMK